ncbi:MAG: hypothetical protein J5I59_06000 [Saprospiraceae bacterium]|nr:hypothetical protein [Saprospiraceae bacterium]
MSDTLADILLLLPVSNEMEISAVNDFTIERFTGLNSDTNSCKEDACSSFAYRESGKVVILHPCLPGKCFCLRFISAIPHHPWIIKCYR